MGLRKSDARRVNPRVYNSGLFGITDKAEPADRMRNSEAGFPVALNYKTRELVQEAMLEAEHGKAQAIARTRLMNYI